MDFRLPENRKEAFIRYYVYGLRTTDCDPAINTIQYIFDRQEMNIEQKYWMVWLFSISYYLPTAYLMVNEFPDFENCDLDRIEKWQNDNYKDLKYQVDCKWNRGHLHTMFKSYKENIGEQTQHQFFMSLCDSEDPCVNYEKVRSYIVDNFFKFGRYLTWMYCQHLMENCGLNIKAPTLLLGESGSDSHTNGVCYALNKEEWLSRYYINDGKKKQYGEWTHTQDSKLFMEQNMLTIFNEINSRFPDVSPEPFTAETSLCAFKKLFRRRQGRYLNYYVHRQAEEIKWLESKWSGVNWDIFWQYRKENLMDEVTENNISVQPDRYHIFLDTGTLPGLEMFEDLR